MERKDAPDGGPLAALKQALQEQGLPLTIQRRVIFESLQGRTDHPTVEGVFAAVGDRLAGLSRTTVYRVLETFVGLGLVRRIDHPGSAARFDPRTDRHLHLICTACGAVEDLDLPDPPSVPLPRRVPSGFTIDDYSVHFTGRCRDCL